MFFRRWVVSKATLGVETDVRVEMYAQLQRLPMLFHSRWQSGQLLSRMMSDLSTIRRFLGFGMLFIVVNLVQIAVVVAILLSLYWPLGLVVLASTVPVVWVSLRTEKAYTRLSRKRPGPDRRRRLGGRGGRARRTRHQVLRPLRPCRGHLRHPGRTAARHRARARPGAVGVLDLPRRHPERDADHRPRLRCARRRPGPGHARHAGRLHHADDVAGLAGVGARLPAVDGPGGHDRRRPDGRDPRRGEHDHRRHPRADRRPRRARPGARVVPLPGRRRGRAARRRTCTCGRGRPSRWSGRLAPASRS